MKRSKEAVLLSLVLGTVLVLLLVGSSSAVTVSVSSDNSMNVNGQACTQFELNTAPIEGDNTVINDKNTLDHVVGAPSDQTLTMATDGSLVTEDMLAMIQYVAISVNAVTNCGPLPSAVYTVIKNKIETGEPLDQIITDLTN